MSEELTDSLQTNQEENNEFAGAFVDFAQPPRFSNPDERIKKEPTVNGLGVFEKALREVALASNHKEEQEAAVYYLDNLNRLGSALCGRWITATMYGDYKGLQAERNMILSGLNLMAMEAFEMSFNIMSKDGKQPEKPINTAVYGYFKRKFETDQKIKSEMLKTLGHEDLKNIAFDIQVSHYGKTPEELIEDIITTVKTSDADPNINRLGGVKETYFYGLVQVLGRKRPNSKFNELLEDIEGNYREGKRIQPSIDRRNRDLEPLMPEIRELVR